MTAREDFLSLLYGERPEGLGMMPYSREEDVDEILARHAHELADKIQRVNAASRGEWTIYNGGLRDAEALIRPLAPAAGAIPGP